MSNVKLASALLRDTKDAFFKKLEEKTSWGKEEVKKMYTEISNEVLMSHLDKVKDS